MRPVRWPAGRSAARAAQSKHTHYIIAFFLEDDHEARYVSCYCSNPFFFHGNLFETTYQVVAVNSRMISF